MGWLCSRCGTENRFRETRCRACLRRGSLPIRLGGLWITLHERLGANRLGGFAETIHDKVRKIAGGANRAVGIGMVLAVVCSAAVLFLGSTDIAKNKIPQMRLRQTGMRIVQQIEYSLQAVGQNGQQMAQGADDWFRALSAVPQKLARRADEISNSADELADRLDLSRAVIDRKVFTLQMLHRGIAERMSKSARQLAENVTKADILLIDWLSGSLGDMRAWIESEQIGWLGGAAQWLESMRNELNRLSRSMEASRP